jgi:plasmid stabilization system protein ParE
MTLEFSPRAVADLQDILEFVARQNPQAAVRLVTMPAVGTRRDDLAPGIRALSHGNYVIYFVAQAEAILRIVRVLHGARNVQPIDFRPNA